MSTRRQHKRENFHLFSSQVYIYLGGHFCFVLFFKVGEFCFPSQAKNDHKFFLSSFSFILKKSPPWRSPPPNIYISPITAHSSNGINYRWCPSLEFGWVLKRKEEKKSLTSFCCWVVRFLYNNLVFLIQKTIMQIVKLMHTAQSMMVSILND